MSKRKEKIKLGKIYRIEDPSGKGHFGMPYKAYKKKKKYDVYKFSHSRKKSYTLKQIIKRVKRNKIKIWNKKRK